MKNNFEKSTIFKGATKQKAWAYKIWVIPYGDGDHWVLFIVIFSKKRIIFIDSLRNTPDQEILKILCKFMEMVFDRAGISKFYWEEWTVFSPKAIPH